jgi:hypothetical protein
MAFSGEFLRPYFIYLTCLFHSISYIFLIFCFGSVFQLDVKTAKRSILDGKHSVFHFFIDSPFLLAAKWSLVWSNSIYFYLQRIFISCFYSDLGFRKTDESLLRESAEGTI